MPLFDGCQNSPVCLSENRSVKTEKCCNDTDRVQPKCTQTDISPSAPASTTDLTWISPELDTGLRGEKPVLQTYIIPRV
jgi:hypothetical protein